MVHASRPAAEKSLSSIRSYAISTCGYGLPGRQNIGRRVKITVPVIPTLTDHPLAVHGGLRLKPAKKAEVSSADRK